MPICIQCAQRILPETADAHRGLCVPCAREASPTRWLLRWTGLAISGVLTVLCLPILRILVVVCWVETPVRRFFGGSVIPKSWLLEPIDPMEVDVTEWDPRLRDQWIAMSSRIRADDRVWAYSSPQESWDRLAGRQGYCIVRGDQIIDSIVLLMS